MQRVTVLCVGKLKEKFYIDAAAEYVKRLQRSCKLDIVELPEYRLQEEPSPAELQQDLPEFGRKTPLKRAGQPVELSGLYVFLASQESSFITAEVFGVTGGMHLA